MALDVLERAAVGGVVHEHALQQVGEVVRQGDLVNILFAGHELAHKVGLFAIKIIAVGVLLEGEGFEGEVKDEHAELEHVSLEGAVVIIFELLGSHVKMGAGLASNLTGGPDLLADAEVGQFDLEGQAGSQRVSIVLRLVG